VGAQLVVILDTEPGAVATGSHHSISVGRAINAHYAGCFWKLDWSLAGVLSGSIRSLPLPVLYQQQPSARVDRARRLSTIWEAKSK
jgi:hypothetical protein